MDTAAELRRNPVSKHQIQPEYEVGQADAGWEDRTRLARPNSQARTGTGKKTFFICSADHEQDWQNYRLIHTLLKVFGKREAHKNWSVLMPEKAAPVTRTTLSTTGSVSSNLAVNAIGKQLRDPINSGLIRWRLTV